MRSVRKKGAADTDWTIVLIIMALFLVVMAFAIARWGPGLWDTVSGWRPWG